MQNAGNNRKLYLITAGCLLFILFFTVFGERGLLRITELNRELAQLEENSAELKAANTRLKEEVMLLNNDRNYLERVAREELGLVKKNEVIYLFTSKKHE
ncbi:MAG: septum formation initiator family protein [Trichlorobacter sp.]|jgi:cell division protein FtsB|nr:septum formation initiator family protein [Trichlorobacter sp.]